MLKNIFENEVSSFLEARFLYYHNFNKDVTLLKLIFILLIFIKKDKLFEILKISSFNMRYQRLNLTPDI